MKAANFSLRQLLCLIAILALACASIVRPLIGLDELLGILLMMYLAYRTTEAILAVGRRRSVASGAAIFAWTYLVVVRVGGIGDTDRLADLLRRWLHPGINTTLNEELFWLGVLVFLVIGAWIGGFVGSRVHGATTEPTESEQSG